MQPISVSYEYSCPFSFINSPISSKQATDLFRSHPLFGYQTLLNISKALHCAGGASSSGAWNYWNFRAWAMIASTFSVTSLSILFNFVLLSLAQSFLYDTVKLNEWMLCFFNKRIAWNQMLPYHARCRIPSIWSHFSWSYVLWKRSLHHSIAGICPLYSSRQIFQFHQLFSYDVTRGYAQLLLALDSCSHLCFQRSTWNNRLPFLSRWGAANLICQDFFSVASQIRSVWFYPCVGNHDQGITPPWHGHFHKIPVQEGLTMVCSAQ